jgi:hypothetical protein
MAHVVGPQRLLICRLAHSTIALPSARCSAAEPGLALISPLMSVLPLEREVGVQS